MYVCDKYSKTIDVKFMIRKFELSPFYSSLINGLTLHYKKVYLLFE